MARHCEVTGEPVTTCECGSHDDDEQDQPQTEPGFTSPDDAA
jgi:hypothetical protein